MSSLIRWLPKSPSKIALVGEAPGEQERLQGFPFVGPEGKYLTKMLKAAGITKSDIYVTNVAHQQPPKNNFDRLPAQVIEDGKAQLKRDLEEWQPNVVIACGAKALEALTGRTKIFGYRGAVIESTLVPGQKVLPTLHPGNLIKGNPAYEPIVIRDLGKAREEAKFPEIHHPQRDVEIVADINHAISVLHSLTDISSPVACDIESYSLSGQMTAYGIATSRNFAYSITKEALKSPSVLRALSEFCDSSTPKIFHNGLFDVLHNALYYNIHNRNWHDDTMIRQHAIMPIYEKSLAFCASIYTSEPYWKDEGKDTLNQLKIGGEIDWDSLYIYNGKDCCLTYEVYEEQEAQLDYWQTHSIHQHMLELLHPCLRAMYTGFRVDMSRVNEFAEENEAAIRTLERICEETIGEFNPKSDKQKQDLLYHQWKMPRQHKKGKLTADRNALERLERFPTPYKPHIGLIRTMMDYYKRRDFYRLKVDDDGRIRYALKVTGTYTGRMSSSKSITGSGMNYQNQPKRVRQFYVADPGKIFINMDLSQVEARIVAALCHDEQWLREFDEEDLHTKVASMLYNLPPQQVRKEFERQAAKRVGHASHYMLGDDHLSKILQCSIKHARALRLEYFNVRPKLESWHDWVRDKIKKDKMLRTAFGRVIQFPGRVDDSVVRKAVAAEPQSTAGDYLNYAIRQMYQHGPEDFGFQLQVHDSILWQVDDKPENVIRNIQAMKELAEIEINVRGVPIVVPTEYEFGYDWKNMLEIEADTSRETIEKTYEKLQCNTANS